MNPPLFCSCLNSIARSKPFPTRTRPSLLSVLFPGLAVLALLGLPIIAGASTIWTGPAISFSKSSSADPTQAANQDRMTDNVWITRGSENGIYNAKTETGFTHFLSPTNTEWASGTTANYNSLTYTDWNTWVQASGGPPSTVGVNAVVHLKSDDIYLDLKFTSWGSGLLGGGAFAYMRSTPAAGNNPPSVTITNPIDGGTFVAPAMVTIQASANDTDGSVTNVQFFDGTTSLGNVASSPFDLSVSLAAGSHTLTAVASDNLGATTTSPAVTVLGNSPPSISITNPIDGATFASPANITIQASANDSDGSVTNVQFFDGTTSLWNVASSPYDLPVSLEVGSHTLTAVASDNLGATKTSSSVTVTVTGNPPPSAVSILNPSFKAGVFSFSFGTQSGYSYNAQFTLSLNPTNWLSFTNFIGDGSVAQVTDADSTNSRRYSRIEA